MVNFINRMLIVRGVLLLMLVVVWSNAQAEINIAYSPIGDQTITVEELGFRLVPLGQDDLAAAADHWLNLLQDKLENISAVQIQLVGATGTEKASLLEKLDQLRQEKTLLVDKTKLILVELQKKGGDIKNYDNFVKAVTGLNSQVSVNDAGSLATTITAWAKSPEGGIRWAKNIVLFLLTLLAFNILAGFLARITERAVQGLQGTTDLLKHFFVNMVRNLTRIIGVMVALSMLEVNVGPLIAALGAVGFIVGFALQGTLSNFASGLMILIYRPYDLGDVVNVAGSTGTVTAMTLVSTTLTLPDNQVVVIPNNAIWGSTITNITGSTTRRVDMLFGIGYGDDIGKAEKVIAGILQDHPLILDDPEPVVKVHELADSSVNFTVRPWVNSADYFDVYWDVTRSVKERFDAEGISIPFPNITINK